MIKNRDAAISRFFYLDLLRALAIFAVIILHNSAYLVNNYGKLSGADWFFVAFYTGISRFCVPVFVVISGSLLLGRETSVKELFTKRLPKLVVPLVVWSIIYVAYQNYSAHTFGSFSLKANLVAFYSGPVIFHFWFLYMMTGIYLVYPIINLFIRSATRGQVEYFLIVWFVANCMIGIIENLSEVSIGIDLGGFVGYTGYFVLGYYLRNYEFTKRALNIICVLTFFAFLISVAGIVLLTIYPVNHGNDVIESDFTPEIPVAVAGLFLLMKNHTFATKAGFWQKIVVNISAGSYGIYIVHVLIMHILFDALHTGAVFDRLITAFSIPLRAIVILILAYLLTKLLKMVPWVRKTI